MSALIDIANLLGGASKEAAAIRQERHDQETEGYTRSMSILQNLISDPQVRPEIKDEATQVGMDVLMESLGYKNQKSSAKGGLRKALDAFVGQEPPAYQNKIKGIGKGNSKSVVGGMQPQPQAGQAGPPMGGPPPMASAGLTPGGQIGQPAEAPPAQGGIPPGAMAPPANGLRYSQAEIDAHDLAKQHALLDMQTQSQIKAKTAENQAVAPFDIGGIQKGDSFDARLIPVLDAQIRANHPDVVTHEMRDASGNSHILFLDKNNQSILGSVNLGQVSVGDQTELNQKVDAYTAKEGHRPDQGTIEKWAKDIRQESSDMVLARSLALVDARKQSSSDLADLRTSRSEVGKSFEPLRDAITRYNVMKRIKDNIAKSPAPGADDMVLLSNHIAMTFGEVKGARLGKDLIEAHLKARDLPDNVRVAAERVLHGDQLSPAQREEFLGLAKDKLDELKASYERTKILWQYSPPGDDKFFQEPATAGGLDEALDKAFGKQK